MEKVNKVMISIVILFCVLLNENKTSGYILTITSSGNNVNFGEVSPNDSLCIIPYATQIVIVSTGGNWSLSAQATGDLIRTSGATKTISISQLQWAKHSSINPAWTSFGTTSSTIASGGTTTASGSVLDYDYKLQVNWTDYPGDYHGTITYSVTAGFLESSFAQPNPFSPDNDGINDTTTIHYYLDSNNTITVTIRDIEDAVIKTLLNNATQTSGAQSVNWDGTNGSGTVVSDNEYKYLIQDINSITIASGIITVDTNTTTGTGTIQGKIKDAGNSAVIANAVVSIYEASGNFVGSTTSNATGDYSFSNLAAGYYYLTVRADYYYPKTSTTFHLISGQTLTKDIYLDHNTSLLVIKKASDKTAQIGDIITYTIKVKNIGYGKINQVKIVDKFPYNFKYIKGTSRLNSDCFKDPIGKNPFTWEIGDFPINEEKILTYKVLVGIDAESGDQKNLAEVSGTAEKGEKVVTNVFAIVRVKDGVFREHGIIIGKVYEDTNGDGIQQDRESGIGNVNIIMENGMSVITDDEGRYSIPAVKPGRHLLMVDINTLSDEYSLNTTKPQFIDLPPHGMAKLDFGILRTVDKRYSGTYTDKPVFIGLAELEMEEDTVTGNIKAFRKKYGNSARYKGCLAFYLNTKLKDKYQLTTSLDTKKTRKDKLSSPANPDDYYPIYGDDSKVVNNTPSSDPIFLKLQSKDLDLVYGDYSTALGENKLSTYNRNLTGAKIEKHIANSRITVFGASTRQVSARDDIPGRGVCGPYYLTHCPIVDGSEKIRIETRDDKNLQVFSTIQKEKDKDYSLDYDTGRLIFGEPISSPGGGVTYYIVVFYEYIPIGADYKHAIYGFRGVTKLHNSLELGTTYIKEEQSPTDYHLYGLDSSFNPCKEFTIKAEYAKTDGDLELLNPKVNNSASFIETLSSHSNDKCKVKTFYHQIGANFSNKIEATADKERDDFNQYGPEFYDITNLTTQKDIREYGSRVDYELMTDKALYVQKKITTNEPQKNKTKTDIFGLGFKQELDSSTFFANFQEENKVSNQIRESRKQMFTLGDRGSIGRHDFGLKYSLTDYDNFINRDLDTITHDVNLKLTSQYDRIFPSIQYDLTDKMSHGRRLLRTHNLTIGATTQLLKSVSLNTSCALGWNADYIEGTKTKSIATTIGIDYSPHPKIVISAANNAEKESGAGKIIDSTTNSFGVNFTPTDKTKLSAKNEVKKELDKEETISGEVELKQKITNDLDTSLKYSYSKDENTDDSTTLLIADLKQKFQYGLTTYGKYTYEKIKKDARGTETDSSESKMLVALAYRPPHTNKFNLLSKCEFGNKSAIASLESIYVPTNKWSLLGKYAMRRIEVEDIISHIDLIIGRLTYNINERFDITGGYRILHQHLTNDYKINPILELGFGFNSHFKFVLGYNLIDYKDGEIPDDSYSARGFYLRLTGRFWQ
ncbi:MAG: carboxypeptidase regulatory-like domain-containing protein [bacterium]